MKTTPYLVFDGNAEEALNHYKSILGGELNIQHYSVMPGNEKLSKDSLQKVMHGDLIIDGNPIIMATDSVENMGPKFSFGNNFFVCLHSFSEQKGKEVFDALSKGGKELMPFEKAFWGSMFGMTRDKYGTTWAINCE